MKQFFRNNRSALLLYILLLSLSLFTILSFDKIRVHLFINGLVGNDFSDTFYYYITYLGDGRMAGVILFLVLLVNIRAGIYTGASFLTASIFANLLKYFYFDDATRPHYIFRWINKLPITYVKGVELNIHNSFPSGHATQAFAIFMCLIFISKNPRLKLLYFVVACLTAFSRVYLSQHWLADITAGSLIGTAFSLFYYYVIISKDRFQKLNRSPLNFLGLDQSAKK